ncbi:ABC transporter permease [bacterium]|nr:ABC transporter permease [bacterium]
MLTLLRTVTLPRLREHPLRTALTVLGITLGVGAFVAVQMILTTLSESYAGMIDTVSGKVSLQITGGEIGVAEDVLTKLQQRKHDGVDEIPGLRAALPTIQTITKYQGETLLVLAVDTLNDASARDYKLNDDSGTEISDPLEFLNSRESLLLNAEFAKKHGIGLDERITLMTGRGEQEFVVKGLLAPKGTATAFGDAFALMDVYAAQFAFGRGNNFDSIDLVLDDGADPTAVAEATEKFLGGQIEVTHPQQRSQGVEAMLRTFRMGLTILSLVVLTMGAFIILNTVTTSVYQRMREIGLLRMIGLTRWGVLKLFTIEGLVIGMIGSVLGVGIGFWAGREAVLNHMRTVGSLFVAVNSDSAQFHPWMAWAGAGLGLGVGLVGSLWPAFRATRVVPVEVLRLRPGLGDGARKHVGLWLIGAAAVGVITLGLYTLPGLRMNLHAVRTVIFGVIAFSVCVTPAMMSLISRVAVALSARGKAPLFRLAAENVLRDLSRSSMAVAAFMVALAVMFQINLFMTSTQAETRSWMEDVLEADLMVTSSEKFATRTSVPIHRDVARELEKIDGVDVARYVRFRLVDFEGSRISILTVEYQKHFSARRFRIVDGDKDRILRDFLDNKGVIVSQNLLAHHPDLQDAEFITVPTPKGHQQFRILGIINDYTTETGMVMVNYPLYDRIFDDELVDTFQIYLKPGADLAAVRERVEETVGKKYDLFVLTNKEFKDAISETITAIFSLAVSLEILTLCVALIGMVNTLVANVIDRTREIGVLRSLGGTRGQIVRIILGQSFLLGLTGVIVGTACGFVMGYLQLTRLNEILSGWAMGMVVKTDFVVLSIVGAMVMAVLSGILPARRAATLPLREALHYE